MQVIIFLTAFAVTLTFSFSAYVSAETEVQTVDISTGQTYVLTSPSYPRNYPDNYNYILTINVARGAKVVFRSTAFDVEYSSSNCGFDYLSIQGKRFCGTEGPSYYTAIPDYDNTVVSVTVRFVTDRYVSKSGFSVRFWQDPAPTPAPTLAPTPAPSTCSCADLQCGTPAVPPNLGTRIVGGVTAVANSWPWQVLTLIVGESFCGGTLISNKWVLTAGMCCYNTSASALEMYMGTHNISVAESSRVMRQARRTILHPRFDPLIKSYDFCLVELKTPAPRNTAISPVCLPGDFDPPADTKCYITGWGSTQSIRSLQVPAWFGRTNDSADTQSGRLRNGAISSYVLMQADVNIVDQNTCSSAYSGQIDASMICAAAPGKDTCRGDSGGPLVCQRPGTNKFVLYGLASAGKGCAQAEFPGLYARISQALPWIKTTVDIFE